MHHSLMAADCYLDTDDGHLDTDDAGALLADCGHLERSHLTDDG